MKIVYCVLGLDPLNEEFQGDSWLIEVFDDKKLAKQFCKDNQDNKNIVPNTYNNTRCQLYICEKVISSKSTQKIIKDIKLMNDRVEELREIIDDM